MMQTAGYQWAWMMTEKETFDGARQGIFLSILFAFLVLLLVTMNIFSALYAILCIACIVISVLATIELIGWQFGLVEGIAVIIIIGFSVDYVVHLANHYVESTYEDRFSRIQDALTAMGISILSGSITTILSVICLAFAAIIFFNKFAVLVTSTILFALYFSMVFFIALHHFIGPQKHFGDIKHYIFIPIWNKITKICKKRDS